MFCVHREVKEKCIWQTVCFLVLAPTVGLALNSQYHAQKNQNCSTSKTVSSTVCLNYEATAVRRGRGTRRRKLGLPGVSGCLGPTETLNFWENHLQPPHASKLHSLSVMMLLCIHMNLCIAGAFP